MRYWRNERERGERGEMTDKEKIKLLLLDLQVVFDSIDEDIRATQFFDRAFMEKVKKDIKTVEGG